MEVDKSAIDQEQDIQHMRMALREAAKGVGLTSPNPPVGCVIIKDGEVLGKGWHRRAGSPHAERIAIANVRRKYGNQSEKLLTGAVLYVTLEPCSTCGRTPPCTEGIIDAGIQRVVYAATDPNPSHQGRARRLLRAKGITVNARILKDEAQCLIRPFTKSITTGIPWVIAKAAVSLDGRITRPVGESRWLTSEAARADAQKLRLRSDAIIVGAGTIRADNPHLTLRGPGIRPGKEQPWRVVLTRSGELPDHSNIFTDPHRERTLLYKRRSLTCVLKKLARKGATTVMIEGGASILTQAFSQGLVDEVCFYIAPMISGSGKPVIDLANFRGESRKIEDFTARKIGTDIRISGMMAT